jgi:hypothetical protein
MDERAEEAIRQIDKALGALHRLFQALAESDRERTIELTALQGLLIEKGIATSAEIKALEQQVRDGFNKVEIASQIAEAEALLKKYEGGEARDG